MLHFTTSRGGVGLRGVLVVLAVLVALAAAVIGYGYWSSRTYAYLSITLSDAAKSGDATYRIEGAQITFFDAVGKPLASAASAGPMHLPTLIHPEVGSCVEAEFKPMTNEDRAKWNACFETHSRWTAQWIAAAKFAELTTPTCKFDRLPIAPSQIADWYLWWVPLPHVGSTPRSYYSIWLQIDTRTCRVIRS